MKIVICVTCLTDGGAERVASLWANGFCNKGNDVHIILTKDTVISYYINSKIKIHILHRGKHFKHFQSLKNDFYYRKLIKHLSPDIIIAVLDGLGPHLKLATLGLGIPIIQTEHNSWERPDNVKLSFSAKFFKFYANKIVDAVTVLTNSDKKVIGNRLKNVFVLPNPLAFEPIDSVPKKKNIILAVGRLDAGYTKGFDVLIQAFSKLDTQWRLQIAGSGKIESFEKYKNLARKYGVYDKVDFLGFVDNPIQLYKDASIFVLSSRYEGFGMVLIEAMSQGCACIACDYKGRQKEIIQNASHGITCLPDDVNGLASALNLFLNDIEYRQEVQVSSISRSHSYALDKIMQKWDEILMEVLKNKNE